MKEKNKIIVAISLVVALLIITLGITYAAFVYRENTNNQQLVLGEIYMYYNEINQLTIENAMPGDDYSNYFEFTVNGMNTYNQKDIYYEVVLTKGSAPDGKIEANRLSDESLLFKLVEVNGEEETILLEDKTYNDLTSQRIYVATIEKNTTQEVNKRYRLYAKISDNITICGGEITEGCDYFTNGETLNWTDAFASVKVSVTGDFEYKDLSENFVNLVKSKYGTDTTLVAVNTEGTLYNGTGEIREYRYSGPTANNYVFFDTNGDGNKTDDEIWRIIGVFEDTIKDANGDVVLENGQPTYEEKVKLMRNTVLTSAELPATYTINGTANTIEYNTLGTAYWNYTKTGTNLNDWTTAGLQYYLNTEHDESETPNAGYLSYLSSKAKSLLSLTTYHLGNVVWGSSGDTTISAYDNERGTIECASSVTTNSNESNCNIWYGNEASWNGYVGLLYPSDWGYSALSSYWSSITLYNYRTSVITASTWMKQTANHSSGEWLLSPSSRYAYHAVNWDPSGRVDYGTANNYSRARGVINLISSATVLDAAGTLEEPYTVVVE